MFGSVADDLTGANDLGLMIARGGVPVRVLLDLVTVKFLASYQTRPMHLFGSVGLGLGLVGCLGVAVSVVMKYTTGPGMTANPLFLLGVMACLMGVQFVSLGLMGEVMARTYFESQGKPPYVVREARNFADRAPRPERLTDAA